MTRPKLLQTAWEDLSAIANRSIAAGSANSARGVTNRILNTIGLLENAPLLGPLHHDPSFQREGYRKLACDGYVCVYRAIDGTPVVYRILNASYGQVR